MLRKLLEALSTLLGVLFGGQHSSSAKPKSSENLEHTKPPVKPPRYENLPKSESIESPSKPPKYGNKPLENPNSEAVKPPRYENLPKSNTDSTNNKPPKYSNLENQLPQVGESIAQDAADVTPDSLVVVANEVDLEVIAEVEDINTPTEEPVQIPDAPEIPETTTEHLGNNRQRYTWCLDNGHGKKTAGKRSPVFGNGKTQLLEYRFNRDIVKRIITALKDLDVDYFEVVPQVNVGDYLRERVSIANRHKAKLPKIFVSVHANAAPAQSMNHWAADSISGIETWYFHGSKRSQRVAAIFQKQLVAATGFKNRHIKSRPNKQFYVLRETYMPAVLTENGFYNNKQQAAELMKEEVRQKIADAHVAAILEIEKKGI